MTFSFKLSACPSLIVSILTIKPPNRTINHKLPSGLIIPKEKFYPFRSIKYKIVKLPIKNTIRDLGFLEGKATIIKSSNKVI